MLDAAIPDLLNPMFAEAVELLRQSDGGLDDFRRLGGRPLICGGKALRRTSGPG